jgi:hypothetical protein
MCVARGDGVEDGLVLLPDHRAIGIVHIGVALAQVDRAGRHQPHAEELDQLAVIDVAARLGDRAMEGDVGGDGAIHADIGLPEDAELTAHVHQIHLAAPFRRQPRHLGLNAEAQFEQLDHVIEVLELLTGHLEGLVARRVADEDALALTRLDEPLRRQPRDRLAHYRAAHAERLDVHRLGRQLRPGPMFPVPDARADMLARRVDERGAASCAGRIAGRHIVHKRSPCPAGRCAGAPTPVIGRPPVQSFGASGKMGHHMTLANERAG